MADSVTPPVLGARSDHVFPTLTPAQIGAHRGARPRAPSAQGEVLIEAGDQVVPFFVVTAGEIEVVRPSRPGETLDRRARPGAVHRRGQHDLGPPRAVPRAGRAAPARCIELDREQLPALVQTDAELSEILMRAFILRRVELIARGLGDVVLIGSIAFARRRCASRSS